MLFKFLILFLVNSISISKDPSLYILPVWENGPACAIYYEIYPSTFSKKKINNDFYAVNYMMSIGAISKKKYEYINNITFQDTINIKDRYYKKTSHIIVPLKKMGKYTIRVNISDIWGYKNFNFKTVLNTDTTNKLLFITPVPPLTVKQKDTLYLRFLYPYKETNRIDVILKKREGGRKDYSFHIYDEMLNRKGDTLTILFPTDVSPGKYKATVMAKTEKGYREISFYINILFSFVNSPEYYYSLVKALGYIYSPSAIKPLYDAPPEKRKEVWEKFWKERDPDPSTPENENYETFMERFNYVNTYFSTYKPGWQTDRGRIYIKLGPPDDIDDHPMDTDSKPYQIWYYSKYNLTFIFMDVNGFGDYILVNKDTEPFLNKE